MQNLDMLVEENKYTSLEDNNLGIIHTYLKEIGKYKLLTFDEEQELFRRIKNGDKKARETVFHCNLKLVVNIAKKYCKGDIYLLQDYIQEGNIGLMRAIDKFDPSLEYKFSTYATRWIKKFITRYRDVCLSDIKKTNNIKKYKSLINEAIIFLEDRYKRTPTDEEISKYTRINIEIVQKIKLCYSESISLNEKISDDQEAERMEFIQSEGVSVEDEAINNYIRETMYSYLTEEEIKFIKMRYGLGESRIYSIDEICAIYGLMRPAIQKKERNIKEKLKRKYKLKSLVN